jgi:hypothetical protein
MNYTRELVHNAKLISFRYAAYLGPLALVAVLNGCGAENQMDEVTTDNAAIEEAVNPEGDGLNADANIVEPAGANSYTCRNSRSVNLSDGYASVNAWLGFNCSDGRAHVLGTVHDIACDSRSGVVTMDFYHDTPTPGLIYRSDVIRAGGGCHTGQTFDRNTGDNTPHIRVFVQAGSGINWTRGVSGWLNY